MTNHNITSANQIMANTITAGKIDASPPRTQSKAAVDFHEVCTAFARYPCKHLYDLLVAALTAWRLTGEIDEKFYTRELQWATGHLEASK